MADICFICLNPIKSIGFRWNHPSGATTSDAVGHTAWWVLRPWALGGLIPVLRLPYPGWLLDPSVPHDFPDGANWVSLISQTGQVERRGLESLVSLRLNPVVTHVRGVTVQVRFPPCCWVCFCIKWGDDVCLHFVMTMKWAGLLGNEDTLIHKTKNSDQTLLFEEGSLSVDLTGGSTYILKRVKPEQKWHQQCLLFVCVFVVSWPPEISASQTSTSPCIIWTSR